MEMRITVKQAEKLATIQRDMDANVGTLMDALANLEDSEVRGEERLSEGDQVEDAFNELCSHIRVFAKALKVPAPDLDGISQGTACLYVLPVFVESTAEYTAAEKALIERRVREASGIPAHLEVGELTLAWKRE